jgi:hypothetical protein
MAGKIAANLHITAKIDTVMLGNGYIYGLIRQVDRQGWYADIKVLTMVPQFRR